MSRMFEALVTNHHFTKAEEKQIGIKQTFGDYKGYKDLTSYTLSMQFTVSS
ncbi:hypothetical protein [Hazenella coriacea]|uniref:hypothetical protein n=1 Tax=Hazenella coriacea TaxID=1179467 RepID=UPI001404891D|nr:hypothetical protein [Hazenella coriacea]